MNQYLRKWELFLDGEKYIESKPESNFRIVFDIHVYIGNVQTFADIRIYNLKESNQIAQGKTIELLAGYEDTCDTIFSGTITNTFKEREGADIVTRMLCMAGTLPQQRGTANATYGAGASVLDVIKDLAKSWPRYLEVEPDQFKDAPPFSSGYTVQGDIPQALNSLAKQYEFEWTEDRGTLSISKPDKERTSNLFEINQLNGMVGIPEVSMGPSGLGVSVTTRLNPFIRVTSRVEISSRFSTYNTGNQFILENDRDLTSDGIYNVWSMHYEGDSYGDAWNLHIEGMRPGTMPMPESVANGALTWGARVDEGFRSKVREIGQRQGLDPNWYMAIMAFETGETFSPSIRNAAGSGATGLIQFMPTTAKGLGTTTDELSLMTQIQQLKFVEDYFNPYKDRIRSLSDMYMSVLWPAAIGKPMDYVLWTIDGQYATAYRQNSGLDKNGDGKITKEEAAGRVFDQMKKGAGYAK